VIDLSRIDFIDSSGLGALVQLAKQCKDADRGFQVVGNARVVQTVKLVRLEEFLHLQPDLQAALGSIAA
jgi:anti-anti-sigma factor